MERFGEDLSLNKLFVREVEKRRCLYDYTYADYSNKELQERSWQEIADVLRSTVQECKSRWKNLRAGLTRYLSRPLTLSGARYVKKYYLFDDLQFILPFIRARPRIALNESSHVDQIDGKVNDEDASQDLDIDVKPHVLMDDLESNSDDYSPHFFEPNCFRQNKRRALNNLQNNEDAPRVKSSKKSPDVDEILEVMRNCLGCAREANPDLDFFRSVLPDIAHFTPAQKRLFKHKVLEAIDEIVAS